MTRFFLTAAIISIFLLLSIRQLAQPALWQNSGITGGSALFFPSFSPHDPDIIYMASDLTGLFYTMDGGISWDVVPFYKMRATVQSKVWFTSHPDTLYTLYNDFETVRQYVFRSDDGGQSWASISSDPADGEATYLFVDPNRTDRLVVASADNIYFSDNSGNSFQTVYTSENLHLAGIFWDVEKIFLGTRDGLLFSDNGGSSFALQTVTNYNSDWGMLSMAGKKNGNTTELYITARHSDEIWFNMLPWNGDYYGDQQIMVISMDETSGFIAQNSGGNLTAYEDFPYFMDLANPINASTFAAGASLDATGNHIHPQVYKLESETGNWFPILQTENNQNISTGYMGSQGDLEWNWSENAMGFGVDPNNPETAIISDFSFAHITRDGGNSWQALYVYPDEQNAPGMPTPQKATYRSNGLENTSCWWLTWTSPSNLFGSYTDLTAIRSNDGGNSWSFDYDGLVDPQGEKYNTVYHVSQHPNGTLYASASTVHDIYQSTHLGNWPLDNGNGAILASTDEGQNWQLVYDFQQPVIWTTLAPDNPEMLYASIINSQTGGVYRTENLSDGLGASWEKLSDPPGTTGHPFNIHIIQGDTILCSYSGHQNDEGFLTPVSGVFYSTNAGESWEDVSTPEMKYWTKDIVIDPYDTNKNTWYACVFDGFSTTPESVGLGGLFRTFDRGQNWQEIGDFFKVESITIHPNDPDIAYVTTESEGLWYTDNLTDENPNFFLQESYPFQQPTRVFFNPFDPNEVWICSFGNGLRKGYTSPNALEEESGDNNLFVYPNPAKSYFSIGSDYNDSKPAFDLELYNTLGDNILSYRGVSEDQKISLNNLAPGVYFILISGKDWSTIKKMVIE